MTPYYQDDLVTIYHGDSQEWWAQPERAMVDVLITDPPYGIEWRQHGGGVNGKTRGSRRHDGIVGDGDTGARDWMLSRWGRGAAAVFGSFRAPFPADVKQVLVYRKSPDAGLMGSVTGFRTDVEPVFLLGGWPKRDARWSAVIESRIGLQTLLASSGHPHAKPVDVLSRLIEAAPPGVVFDPFMGSGSTLVAAKMGGRFAVGVEIDERWCERAAIRCSQEVLGLVG